MLRVIGCLTESHNLALVALAAALCVASSRAALALLLRAREARVAGGRMIWTVLAAGIFAAGIWATHFVAILAYDAGLPTAYDAGITAASALILLLAGLAGFGLCAIRPAVGWCALGGALLGSGVGGMHYFGMTALRLPGRLAFDPGLVAFSVMAGSACLAAALAASVRPGRLAGLLAAGGMTAGVVVLHFSGMGAVQVLPDGGMAVPIEALDRKWLALMIAGTTLSVLLAGSTAATVVARQRAAASTAEATRLHDLANATFEGIAILNPNGTINDANQRLTDLLAMPRTAMLGQPLSTLLSVSEFAPQQLNRLLIDAREIEIPGLLRAHRGEIPVEFRSSQIGPAEGGRMVVAIRDIRARLAAEARIQHMANHDALTGLANRVLLRDRLSQALAWARHDGPQVAILYLDLDRFKAVNDTFGHSAGDKVLRTVAARLRRCVREADTVARIGGDEFIILQTNANNLQNTNALAQRLAEELARPHMLEGQPAVTGVSIGIALAPGDGDDPDVLLGNADLALYQAKSERRGGWRFFEPQMNERMRARRALELDLRRALAAEEFELFYQPTVDLRSGHVRGFEALIRWQHPERGMIPPADFIPLAEEIGLIIPLGHWVLQCACRDAASWPAEMKVAVNLSSAQFAAPGLVESVAEALQGSGLSPSRLELEITETVMMQDTEATLAILRALRELGVSIAMDDFGTGYSSLSYLRKFPFNRVKIDRSFIEDLESSASGAAIVRAIMELCGSLGMESTAEGVETEEQLRHLRDRLGSAVNMEVQGYLISRPKPVAEVPALLHMLGKAAAQPGIGVAASGLAPTSWAATGLVDIVNFPHLSGQL
jgi:diguanylate cyclase (GGDEF)-like protein